MVVESRTLALAQSCLNPVVIRHPGGHFLPPGLGPRAEIVNFAMKHLPESSMDAGSLEIGRI